jgi:hypothetical protein
VKSSLDPHRAGLSPRADQNDTEWRRLDDEACHQILTYRLRKRQDQHACGSLTRFDEVGRVRQHLPGVSARDAAVGIAFRQVNKCGRQVAAQTIQFIGGRRESDALIHGS